MSFFWPFCARWVPMTIWGLRPSCPSRKRVAGLSQLSIPMVTGGIHMDPPNPQFGEKSTDHGDIMGALRDAFHQWYGALSGLSCWPQCWWVGLCFSLSRSSIKCLPMWSCCSNHTFILFLFLDLQSRHFFQDGFQHISAQNHGSWRMTSFFPPHGFYNLIYLCIYICICIYIYIYLHWFFNVYTYIYVYIGASRSSENNDVHALAAPSWMAIFIRS